MTAASDKPPWAPAVAIVAVLFGFALALVSTILVDLVSTAAGGSVSHPTPIVNLVSSVLFDLSFVAAALYAVRAQGRVRPADFGYRRVPVSRAVAAVVLAAIVYFGVSELYGSLLGLKGEKLPKELGFGTGTGALVAAGLFVCVIAPILEEFFFRGFLFGALRQLPLRLGGRDLGPPVAAVLVGILFGAAHLGSAKAEYIVPLAFFGFILCLLRWRTGSLYPGMALHSINNALALGINQLQWDGGRVLGLSVASLLAIAALTLPLASTRTAAP